MFRLLFILPIILCLAWYFFLTYYAVPIKQGKKGFIYILIFSLFILSFFIIMMKLTEYVPNN